MPSTAQPDRPATRRLYRPAPGRAAALAAVLQIAQHTRGEIRGLSGQALQAQANSLPGLACHLLAGSQPNRD